MDGREQWVGPWSTPTVPTAPARRRVGPGLALGIILAPIVFCWFTLRRGHSNTARIVSLCYATVATFVGMVAVMAVVGLAMAKQASDEAKANAIVAAASGESVTTDPDDLAAAFREGDEGRARFAGRIIVVRGEVVGVRMKGRNADLRLRGTGRAVVTASLMADIDPMSIGAVEGRTIEITCRTITHMLERPILLGCSGPGTAIMPGSPWSPGEPGDEREPVRPELIV